MRLTMIGVVMAIALIACEPMAPEPAAPAATPEPAAPPPPERTATCADSAIRLVGRSEAVHGAIVKDVLYMGGETADATCRAPTDQRLRTVTPAAQTQEAEPDYFLLVVKYPAGNRLYVVRT